MEDERQVLGPGYKLDRYELLCQIASGGMATVWLARLRGKRGFEKLYAIKTIKTELISDPRYQEMFLDEARIASGIEHPNVAQILDLGEQDDILYIVMEWVDGESLAKVHRLAMKRGEPLPLGLALHIMADACAGLHAAHSLKDENDASLGVVHRDVSPENILVTTSGAVKVIDFGVAKAKNRGAGDTRGGIVKGKVRYMAPEQVKSLPVDHRADVWAIGMCLYELVTASERTSDEDDVEVLRRLLSEDPVPRMQGLPERLLPIMPILTRSLVADPDSRFESASAMRRALLAAVDELGLSSASEDIADFLAAHLGDLAKKRRAQVSKAIEQGKIRKGAAPDARVSEIPSSTTLVGGDEVAFAPTIVSDTNPEKSDPARELPPARTTGGATLSEQLGARPKGGNGVWIAGAVVVLCVIGFFVWRAKHAPATTTTTPPPAVSTAPPPTPSETPVTTASVAPIELGDLPPPTPSAGSQPSTRPSTTAATAPPPSAKVDAGAPVKIDGRSILAPPVVRDEDAAVATPTPPPPAPPASAPTDHPQN